MLKIFETDDGSNSIHSGKFGESYHSKFGALSETLHVFIQAGLKYIASQTKEINILEIGFGTGLNALATFQEANTAGLKIYYITVEAFPISIEIAKALNFPTLFKSTDLTKEFLKFHELDWNIPFDLSKLFLLKNA